MSRARCPPVLPQELIIEILSQLLVKDLMRFRCVCKSWNSIIFNPTLVKLHRERSSNEPHIILTLEDITFDPKYDDDDICVVPYSKNRLFKISSSTIDEDGCYQSKINYWVIDSCNGLVCLYSFYDEDHKDGFYELWVRFWNPTTRMRSKKSPCLRVGSQNDVNCGFGYHDSSDIYKVIFVFSDYRSEKTEVLVYCLGDNCWTNVLCFPSFPVLDLIGQYLNGTINWLALDKLGFHFEWKYVTVNQLVIFSFDLQKETYKYLLLPNDLSEVPDEEPKLVVLRDCLCLCHNHQRTHFVVWQMSEFGVEKSWSQLVKVSFEHLQCEAFLDRSLFPLCISENGDVLLLVNNDDLELILYNRRNNMVEHTKIPDDKAWLQGENYIQSLVLPYIYQN